MTVCDLCKGTGKLLKPWYDTTGAMTGMTGDICFMCDGKGTIGEPMTNEEWFCELTTEEKADFMSRVLGCSNCPIPKDGRSCMGTYSGCWNEIIKWLKQPHTKE